MTTARRAGLLGKAVTALVVLLGAATAHAGVILFSDLGESPVYNCCNNYFGISGPTSGAGAQLTEYSSFAPSSTALLGQIDVATEYVSGTNSAQLILAADSAGLPGTVLETWTLTNLPALGTCCVLQTVTPTSAIMLISGVQYWVGASAIATDTFDILNTNSIGASGPVAESFNGGPVFGSTAPLVAFDVLSVPEPGTFVLVAAGLALCLARRRYPSALR